MSQTLTASTGVGTPPRAVVFRLQWLAFRAVLMFAILQWLPLSIQLAAGPLTLGLWKPPIAWGAPTFNVGRWVLASVLRLPDHSPQTYLSANDLPLFLGMVAAGVVACIVAALWTLAKPWTAHPRLFAWLYTANRYMLAATILVYGWNKVLLVQFAPSLDYYAHEVAQHNPRDLLWAFMMGSSSYQFFAGLVEVVGGLMLLSRRTMLLGALLSVGALGNVLALDIGYDVGVKFIALEMLLMAAFAVAPYVPVLVTVSIKQIAPPIDAWPDVAPPLQLRSSAVIALAAGLWLSGATLHAAMQDRARVMETRQTPLYGIWDVERITRGGSDLPLLITSPQVWRRFVFQSKNAAVIFTMANYPPAGAAEGRGNGIRYTVRIDESNRSLQMTPFQLSGISERLGFAYTLSDADHLELTNSDQDLVVRLRRFDVAAYPLISWKPRWSW